MEEIPFENAMARLEEIVDLMNQPSTSLDSSLKLYEEADALMRICESRIRKAEDRVRELSEKRNETLLSEEESCTH
ncbi:exodeoxyribonuclease VII small subunit [Chlamydia caviae]|uniref:Exodeoxyribonuclease 7 small subunit n=1 Tax=Chlamydia caviae (strain ATCC VR-813 / DSM 19441 / 03DC25 / GPIC) TaxID=227941 RepID=EX7S_CHLCV|nr:exodeoxyribonuclease VII small subunit [Chlamydia caviae]Q823U9.1 RecName: Full=Exodeoxyribonuclease 7 small subunit; AltName: Full=Exodeoxyribonuclease VII small subunit; Short=Exonuclease VII small subunit [Chlamydia caviae GPIC]AAP05055.1 exodeoxyribonuclease VII, small subunit [Chlamydia caviae GPIC]